MNPSDDAKKLMEEIKLDSPTKIPEPIKVAEKFEVKETKPIDNLINEAREKNMSILQGLNVKPNTYDKIMVILKDGGMDSASQIKSLEKIKEVLNEKEN
jgi:hypothetical protein